MEDATIIQLFFARDQAAIAETANKYGGYLRQVAFNICRSSEDAEEIVEDTYMGAWNAIPPTRPQVLRHFLSRIARNLSFSRLDYRAAQKRGGGAAALLSELDECVPDGRGSAEAQWELKEIGAALDRFLATLRREDCALFLSRYYYALTIKEVAARYALSERAAKYRLARLRQRLREHLQKEDVLL